MIAHLWSQGENVQKLACLSYWFPVIRDLGLPVPRTQIVRTDVKLIELVDGRQPKGLGEFIIALAQEAEVIGLPLFLRTGQTSGKHDWRNTCRVEKISDLLQHVVNLVEFSEMVDLRGLDTDVWALREFLHTEAAFIAFNGMPITTERRYFVENDTLVCHHPYWPVEAIEGETDVPDWRARLQQINQEGVEVEELGRMARLAGSALHGKWSVDFLFTTDRGWVLTDMAPAQQSWHWPDCPEAEEMSS